MLAVPPAFQSWSVAFRAAHLIVMCNSEGQLRMRIGLVLLTLLLAGCSDPVAPGPAIVRIEITSLDRIETGQWMAAFSITNGGTAVVFLPRCDVVNTGLERWTGSEWRRMGVESCIAIRAQDRIVLEPGAVVSGDRVIPPAGRYHLHLRYSHEAGHEFDRIAATGPIDTE
jgi:hypothetical protein